MADLGCLLKVESLQTTLAQAEAEITSMSKVHSSKSVHFLAWQVYSIPLEYLFQCNDMLSAQVSDSFMF
jgi:hypothetical protein